MPECENCGSHVTNDFHRVFSDNNGVLHGCIECMTGSDLKEGKASGSDDYSFV